MDIQEEKIAVFGLLVRDGQILIVRRTKQEVGANGTLLTWGFPGGKVEPDETVEKAVVREVYEETGFDVTIERLISERTHPDFPVRAMYFFCRLSSDAPDEVSDGTPMEMSWVRIADVGSYFTSELDAGVRAFIENF